MQSSDVCLIGFALGLIITLILVYLYMQMSAENFVDPNSLSPEAQSLLNYHLQRNPVGMGAKNFLPVQGKSEKFCHNKIKGCY